MIARLAPVLPLLLLLVAAPSKLAGQAPRAPEWEDPGVFAVGAEKPRATFVPYATRADALAGDRTRSPYLQSLNGTWKFRWVRNPFEVPAGFEAPAYDDAG